MYAALATAWNLLGGFSGYLSLGHVAFFGIGAYAIGDPRSQHIGRRRRATSRSSSCRSSGSASRCVAVPIGWVALRTRAATFAIVTLTLLFVVQQLAFNLHALTGGSQGLALPLPAVPARDLRAAVLPARCSRSSRVACSLCWYVRGSQARADAARDPRRRGPRARARRRRPRRKVIALRRQRRAHGDGRRRLGLLHRLHLPAVRGRPADHDRRWC